MGQTRSGAKTSNDASSQYWPANPFFNLLPASRWQVQYPDGRPIALCAVWSTYVLPVYGGVNLIKGLLPAWAGSGGAKGDTLALTLTDHSVRYVLASKSDERGATIAAWGAELRGNQTRDAFMKRIKTLLPSAGRVIAVLDPADYQIVQIESPNVPPEELNSAVRWRATEFVDGSPHDYTLDVLAVSGEPERPANVIAVLAHNDIVRARMLDCQALGRPLSVIDVVETSQRNLLNAVLLSGSSSPSVAALLVAAAGRALMVIAIRGQLYFFRRFEFDADTLAVTVDEIQAALVGSSASEDSASRSLTQLHRSLDLWDDSYPNLPLAMLLVEAGSKTAAIISRLKPETGVETRPLILSTVFKLPPSKASPPWLDPAYLPLLGALLRPVEVE